MKLRACLQLEPRSRRRAFVLVAILVVILLASMVAVSLMFSVKAENTAVAATGGAEQAWAAALSGVQEAMRVAARIVPGATDWQDQPRVFRARQVFDDGSDRWFFTVWSPVVDDALNDVRYGLTDEAGKVNLNAAHTTNLVHLPRLTVPLVAALRDFIDWDDTARQDGAEQEHYSGLPVSYAVRNGPLDTLDEALLVRGFTPSLWFGEDANMNWRLEPNEDDGDERWPADNNDSRLDAGLRQHFTVVSYDPNRDNDRAPRTNLNDPADPLPGVPLPASLTNYLAALRTNGFRLAHPADLLTVKLKVKDDKGREVEIGADLDPEQLSRALDLFTCSAETRFDGLLNVNTASIAALQSVPGIDEPLAESILSARRGLGPERRATLAWLLEADVVDAALFRQIAPFLCARGFQYSFHVVGYGLPSGRYRVFEVMVDVAGDEPRVIYLRELTRLGLPFPLEGAPADASGGETGTARRHDRAGPKEAAHG